MDRLQGEIMCPPPGPTGAEGRSSHSGQYLATLPKVVTEQFHA